MIILFVLLGAGCANTVVTCDEFVPSYIVPFEKKCYSLRCPGTIYTATTIHLSGGGRQRVCLRETLCDKQCNGCFHTGSDHCLFCRYSAKRGNGNGIRPSISIFIYLGISEL